MNVKELGAITKSLGVVIKDHIAAALAERDARMAVLEQKAANPGPKGDPGEKGERGESGPQGPSGQDATVDVAAIAASAAALIPAPKDGRDGLDGKDGPQGPAGEAASVDVDAIAAAVLEKASALITAAVSEALTKAIAALPAPKDGKDGRDGQNGKDGIGVADALIDKDGQMVVTFADGRVKALGVVQGAKGEPGKDGIDGKDGTHGQDGLGFEDLTWAEDEAGRPVARFVRGEIVKDCPIPCVIDRGVWRDGSYRKGDGVTWGGSFFIAQKDTTAKPETNQDWRLAIKRGRDGKDGKAGPIGLQGPRGKGWNE